MSPETAEPTETSSSSPFRRERQCHHFSFAEIQSATQNFDDSLVIGRGGFGKVYKGPINIGPSSTVISAIKRLDSGSKQGASEFWAEIEMLSNLRHCHLVSLIGYCNDSQEMILVYEYMPHGTLDDHLHKLTTPLSWLQRLRICIGAARGLDYLHTGTGTQHGVIHRDVKSSNILLDENCAAKISDFGLSKIGPTNQPLTCVSTAVKGTFGYVDPDYFSSGRLTRKSDVYSFGVVLFEVLGGRRAVDTSLDEDQWGLARWAQDCIEQGKLNWLVDFNLRGQILPKCLKGFAQIAGRCLHNHPKQRPTIAEVVARLEFVLSLQERTDSSIQSAGIMTFTRKVQNFFFASSQGNSVHVDANAPRENRSHHEVAVKGSLHNQDSLLNEDGNVNVEVPPSGQMETPNLKLFTFAELKRMTSNFKHDCLLTEEALGKVFKGWVDKNTWSPSKAGVGMAVAVKKHSQDSMQGHREWLTEVSILGLLSHSNIIKLFGYCKEDEEMLLVYEYMPKGVLASYSQKASAVSLPWATRLKIMIGAARSLAFLHTSEKKVIHRHIKSSCILLDKDFNAKLAGFGLARSGPPDNGDTHISTRVMGTYGYAAPEYIATGHLGVKSDVYSFGVVLLETLSGLPPVDRSRPRAEHNLVEWARPLLCNKRGLKKIIDPRLENDFPPKGAILYAALTAKCLQSGRRARPSMEEVLQSLEQINAIQIQP